MLNAASIGLELVPVAAATAFNTAMSPLWLVLKEDILPLPAFVVKMYFPLFVKTTQQAEVCPAPTEPSTKEIEPSSFT